MSQPLNVFEVPLSGISLVEASAGTGKTYNITSLYVRAILEKGLDPSQILVMTYTEAATAELKFRLRNRLKESLQAIINTDKADDNFLQTLINQNYDNAADKLKAAIDHFDEAAVFTIHGFCSRMLSEYSLQFGVSPNFELLTDQSELLQDCVDEYWRSFIRSADSDEYNHLLLDYLTDEGFGPDELKSVVNEILSHPGSKVIPDNYDQKRLYKLLDQFQSKFEDVLGYWEQEGEELEAIYRGDDLNRGVYRKSSEESDWAIFQDWLNNDKAKIWYSDRLEKFGTKLSKSGKKSAPEIQELNILQAIDEYMSLADELKRLKIVFVQESIDQIRQKLKFQKEKDNLLSYNDLLESVEEGLRNDASGKIAERLSQKYPLALVDEFQDTDPTQYGIFRQIYHGRQNTALFMIGDPKQAIYGFRGADIFTYLTAKDDSDESQSYTLSENYRSNSLMIKGVNELFEQSSSPFLIEGLSFQSAQFPSEKEDKSYLRIKNGEVRTPLQAIVLDNEEYTSKNKLSDDIYASVCNEVIELLSGDYTIDGGKVQERDIAILIRKGYQGEEIQQKLREKGLKSVLKSRSSVFSTREADELFLVLKSIQKVSNEAGVRAALATELLGFTAVDIQELLDDEQSWSVIIQKFVNLRELWENQGIEPAIEKLFRMFDIQERLSAYTDAERRITNLVHLSELLGNAQRDQHVQGKSLLKWYYQKQQDDTADSDAEQLRLESDEDLIQISTIHASKGLQYPIVICPFLWDSGADIKKSDILKFHQNGINYIDISQAIPHPDREDYEQLTRKQEMAEEVRLTYVALTRAVAASFVFVPNYNKIETSPLSSILQGLGGNSADFITMKSILEKCNQIEVRPSVGARSSKRDTESGNMSNLKAADFQRKDIFQFPRMLSYSSLAEGGKHPGTAHDYDEIYNAENKAPLTIDKYGFPRGANAGTCLHNIFEDISFESPQNLEQAVDENLDYYGFEELWNKPVQKWIRDTLNMDLGKPRLSLSSIKDSDVLKEMEFFFPVDNLKPEELWKLIRGEGIETSNIEQASGFLKGFIDLIFRVGDQYFILDYKSNYLGDTQADYSPDKLDQAMKDAGYDLQYHIYTVALHRFLQKRIKGYEYNENFGGVLYLFLRGVEQNKPGSGVFFDKPDFGLINQLDDYFNQGGGRP